MNLVTIKKVFAGALSCNLYKFDEFFLEDDPNVWIELFECTVYILFIDILIYLKVLKKYINLNETQYEKLSLRKSTSNIGSQTILIYFMTQSH